MLSNKAEMDQIRNNTATLTKLSDTQLIMMALSALIMEAQEMPPGTRYPLHSELRRRGGLQDPQPVRDFMDRLGR